MFDIFSLPFMQRAFISGLALAVVLAFLGVYVTLRKMSFLGDGMAHASLGSIAIGIALSVNPIVFAVIFGVFLSVVVYLLERNTKLSFDAIVGIIFASGMAVGIVIISKMQGYQPELVAFLFGSILSVGWSDMWIILLISAISTGFLVLFYRHLTLLSLHRDMAIVSGIRVDFLELLFTIIVSVSIIVGVKLLGVVLISALLVIPPSISKVISMSFRSLVLRSILLSECIVIGGLFISYYFDLPSGATIVLIGALLFTGVVGVKKIF